MATQPPLPGFLRLPQEIMSQITGHFGRHDKAPATIVVIFERVFWQEVDLKSLSQLSKTCKALREAVLPELFNTIYVNRLNAQSFQSLALNIVQNPGVCKLVKRLVFEQALVQIDYSIEAAAGTIEVVLRPYLTQKVTSICKTGSLEFLNALDDPESCVSSGTIYRYYSTLLLAYTAETLELVSLDYTSRPFAVFPPDFFPRLAQLGYGYWYDNSRELRTLGDIDSIMSSAPKLRILKATRLRSANLPCRLDHLETLDLSRCSLGATSFMNLTHNLPGLRSFLYCVDRSGRHTESSNEWLDESELISLLQPWRNTLRDLHINMKRYHIERCRTNDILEDLQRDIRDLSSLQHVESLTLGDVLIPQRFDRLAQMLPRSLRTLRIDSYLGTITSHHLELLLDDVPARFPQLKAIHVHGFFCRSSPMLPLILERCTELGISAELSMSKKHLTRERGYY